MSYHARLVIMKDVDSLRACFTPLLARELNDRASVRMRKTAKGLVFTLVAKDPVSFRATMNMITQSLSIYERMKHIPHGTGKTTTTASS